MVFGKSKFDKRFEKDIKNLWSWVTQLNKSQEVLIKNNNRFIPQIAKLEKDNKAQSSFDNQVAESIKNLDAKLTNALELAKDIKELKNAVGTLQSVSHKHEVAKE